jgi:hypothetical protein
MKSNTKFWLLTAASVVYLAWTFYISEPQFLDNSNKKIETFDWISVPEYNLSYLDSTENQEVETGIVLQTDGERALVKIESRYLGGSSQLEEVNIKSGNYRIVGRGTIYHKVNHYIGFNMFLISQFLITILMVIFVLKLLKHSNI